MTIWKERSVGDPHVSVHDVSEELGEPAVMLAERPDWVRRPDTGEQLRVLDATIRQMSCPSCQTQVKSHVLILEQDIEVMECSACQQFMFYRTRQT